MVCPCVWLCRAAGVSAGCVFAFQLQGPGLEDWQDAGAGEALLGGRALADWDGLTQQFAAAVAHSPGDWLTWLYLARLHEMPGAAGEVSQSENLDANPDPDSTSNHHAVALQQAQLLEPVAGESLHWLGVWRLTARDARGAISALGYLLEIRPVRFGSMMFLGEALLRVGNVVAAQKAFARASRSNTPSFCNPCRPGCTGITFGKRPSKSCKRRTVCVSTACLYCWQWPACSPRYMRWPIDGRACADHWCAPDAPLVFGSFNNAMKLSPTTMALWSCVLRALP